MSTRPRTKGAQVPRSAQVLSSAYRDLEVLISDLRSGAAVLGEVAEKTIGVRGLADDNPLRKLIGFDGFVVHLWTQDQAEAIDYAARHVRNLIMETHRRYFDRWEEDLKQSGSAN